MQNYDYWISSILGVVLFVYIAFHYRFAVRLFCSRIMVLKLDCVSELQEDLLKETTKTADSCASPPEFLIPVSLGQGQKFAILINFRCCCYRWSGDHPWKNHCYRIDYNSHSEVVSAYRTYGFTSGFSAGFQCETLSIPCLLLVNSQSEGCLGCQNTRKGKSAVIWDGLKINKNTSSVFKILYLNFITLLSPCNGLVHSRNYKISVFAWINWLNKPVLLPMI